MNLITKFLVKIGLVVILFLYIYPLKVISIPYSFRILLAVPGFLIFFYDLIAKRIIIRLKFFLQLFFGIFILLFVTFISLTIANPDGQPFFAPYMQGVALIFFGAYTVIAYSRLLYGSKFNSISISKYIVLVTLLQAIISLLMFTSPAVSAIVDSIQQKTDLAAQLSNSAEGLRLLGLGASFFNLGIVNTFSLIMIAVLLKSTKQTARAKVFLIISYLIIFFIGMMQARSTSVGLILSIAYLFFSSAKLSFKNFAIGFKSLMQIILTAIVLSMLFIVFAGNVIEKYSGLITFGFEMVANYQENGTLQTSSTNDLQDMYTRYPTEERTYLVGDGQLAVLKDGVEVAFYKGVDVGYFRLVYYIGVPGLLAFLICQIIMMVQAFKDNIPNGGFVTIYIILFLLLMNAKGVVDAYFLIFPYWIINVIRLKKANTNTA